LQRTLPWASAVALPLIALWNIEAALSAAGLLAAASFLIWRNRAAGILTVCIALQAVLGVQSLSDIVPAWPVQPRPETLVISAFSIVAALFSFALVGTGRLTARYRWLALMLISALLTALVLAFFTKMQTWFFATALQCCIPVVMLSLGLHSLWAHKNWSAAVAFLCVFASAAVVFLNAVGDSGLFSSAYSSVGPSVSLLCFTAGLSTFFNKTSRFTAKSTLDIDDFATKTGHSLTQEATEPVKGLMSEIPYPTDLGRSSGTEDNGEEESVTVFGRDPTILDGDAVGIKRLTVANQVLDRLTGVLNTETLRTVADQAIAQTKRYGRPHSALMLRMDDFASITEDFGAPTAERAVKLLAITCKRELRESDAFGRIDDHVFVALLPETEVEGAKAAMQRTCASLSERTVPTAGGMKRLVVSASTTPLKETDSGLEQVVERLKAGLTNATLK